MPTLKEIQNELNTMSIDEAVSYLYSLHNNYNIKVDRLLEKHKKRQEAHNKELARLEAMSEYEKQAWVSGIQYIAGIDEAGRGPLAGPVVAAAVIFKQGTIIEGINDSKKLSEKKREELFDIIKEKAEAYGIGIVEPKIIDEINILNATKRAMIQAVNMLATKPQLLLIDAVKLEDCSIKQQSIIKGDAKSISIAAASIIAKVTRDRLIKKYDLKYSGYGFAKHKGYGTKEHIDAIKKFGVCPIHRMSFIKNFL